ncbi:TrgA family protein [Parasulfitobacter algicola]|uniref:TrgA family protein n=1 Tax=Parasulfitobacter algicola TaxID=2614809 RepID=A0ABX2IY16_9RHOB|nr:TrgA family protein [Sulfitobacter algicola]NSX55416.1 TrgA family protein [Sulfitobacter algicola]
MPTSLVMPTAAKLTAAIAFGGLAMLTANLVIEAMPTEQNMGYFIPINILIGAGAGWMVAGSRAPGGYVASFSYGITAAVIFAVVSLFTFSSYIMIIQSLRRRYDNGMEAVVGVFELMAEHFIIMANYEILGTLLIGGMLAGMLTEWVGQRFA